MLSWVSRGIDSGIASAVLRTRYNAVECLHYPLSLCKALNSFANSFAPSICKLRHILAGACFDKLVCQRYNRDTGTGQVVCMLCNTGFKTALAYLLYNVSNHKSGSGHYMKQGYSFNGLANALVLSKSQQHFRALDDQSTM